MDLGRIFDVFSRRRKPKEHVPEPVSESLRNKVFLLCNDVLGETDSLSGGDDLRQAFWREIHQMLLYRHGRLQLTEVSRVLDPTEDVALFLGHCRDDEFLDFVEYVFRVNSIWRFSGNENAMVARINELFESEGSSYFLTRMAKETVSERSHVFPFSGREVEVVKTVAFPKVVERDTELIHNNVTMPVLELLSDPRYKSANGEYLAAMEDFRKGDFADCLTKSASALESVMKVICELKKWPIRKDETASGLIKIVVERGKLDPYFREALQVGPTLRNKLGSSHGAGSEVRSVPRSTARYAMNVTGSAMLYLVDELG